MVTVNMKNKGVGPGVTVWPCTVSRQSDWCCHISREHFCKIDLSHCKSSQAFFLTLEATF